MKRPTSNKKTVLSSIMFLTLAANILALGALLTWLYRTNFWIVVAGFMIVVLGYFWKTMFERLWVDPPSAETDAEEAVLPTRTKPALKKLPHAYGPFATVGLVVALFILAQLIVIFIALPMMMLVSGSEKFYDSAWGQFSFVLLIEVVTMYLLWQVMKWRKITFRQLGWNMPRLKYVGYALLGFASYFLLYIMTISFIRILIPSLDLEQQQEIGFDKSVGGVELLPVFISLVILPPLVEEIVARGFLYTNLRAHTTVLMASFVTSVLFAAAHLSGAAEGLLWVAAIDTFILSLVMCYLRERSGSLWPPIGVHFIKNGVAFFILFNIAGRFR